MVAAHPLDTLPVIPDASAVPRNVILQGDCLTLLRTLPDNSIDAVVTDPPAGIGFMGKGWDHDKGGRRQWIAWLAEVMEECLRVVKPGGHAVVWALPRTSHWTATALEDAGWEIRDCVLHIFGSGFPKSLDVSKQIDKMAGAERQRVRPITVPRRNRDGTMALGGGWQDDPWETTPATQEALAWQGWGTALKPSQEMWWLCRKPLSEPTIAANVLRWGTGAIHVDACRVNPGERVPGGGKSWGASSGAHNGWKRPAHEHYTENTLPHTAGRWPSNLVLSHAPDCSERGCSLWCPVRELDAQSGVTSGRTGKRSGRNGHGLYGLGGADFEQAQYQDTGGASRYFPTFRYVPKASRSERDAGCEQLPLHSAAETVDRIPDSAGMQSPRAGAGSTSGAHNFHPTTKPVTLMRWLCRLITPPGGVILDPFAGSGTTAVAAALEGFNWLLCEREAEYLPIIEARTAWAMRQCEHAPVSSQTSARHSPTPTPSPAPRRTTRPAPKPKRQPAAQPLSLWG